MLLDFSVKKGGQVLDVGSNPNRWRKSAHFKNIRFWGEAEEEITLRVHVGDSYDLQNRPLTFSLSALYPNQGSVSIVREGNTPVYRITAFKDPSLPKGRNPITVVANNGVYNSNPAVISFFWLEPGDAGRTASAYFYPENPGAALEYTRNLRPVFSIPQGTDFSIRPGQQVSFDLNCSDPEGFPVRFYRWSGEVGTLAGTRYTFQSTAADAGKVRLVHFICSDGTGGYNSLEAVIAVESNNDSLPAPWHSVDLGNPTAPGTTNFSSNRFHVTASGFNIEHYRDQGQMVYKTFNTDVDLVTRVSNIAGGGPGPVKAGVMVRDDLGNMASSMFAYIKPGQAPSAYARINEAVWVNGQPSQIINSAELLRVTRFGTTLAGYASNDGVSWEQIWSAKVNLGGNITAGFALTAGDFNHAGVTASADFDLLATPAVSIPSTLFEGSRSGGWDANRFAGQTTLTLTATPGATIYYTLDGSLPTTSSPRYTAPVLVNQLGTHTLRARAFAGSQASDIAMTRFIVE